MLVYSAGNRFLSLSVTIKLLSNVKCMVTFIFTNVRVLGSSHLGSVHYRAWWWI